MKKDTKWQIAQIVFQLATLLFCIIAVANAYRAHMHTKAAIEALNQIHTTAKSFK